MSDDSAAYEGLFDSESLNVRLGFTRAAYEAAEAAARPGSLPEDAKTYVHELTHYVQATTTPYGLFIHYCREVQTTDVVTLVRALLGAGIEFKRPLIYHVPVGPGGPVGPEVRGALMRWINTEILVASLAQDRSSLEYYIGKLTAADALVPLLPPVETFRRLQGGIAQFIASENACRERSGVRPWDNGAFDAAAINAEGDGLGSDIERSLERANMALNLSGNPWGTESIIESAATAAEWAESGAGLDALRAFAADNSDPDIAMYKNCLERGLEAIPADDLQQFAFTYIALSELALHAPLLPQHAGLRAGRVNPEELFPPLRFQALLSQAGKVGPLQGLNDVARYNLEMCKALGWVHPTQMIAAALDGPQAVADQRAQRYIWAQAERARGQHAFTNLTRRVFDPSPAGEQFRERYAFPVIEYTDRTFYMKDKDALWALTTEHLFMTTMRYVMLGKTLTVECPYRGAPDEYETLTGWLQEALQASFHRSFPTARVTGPQR